MSFLTPIPKIPKQDEKCYSSSYCDILLKQKSLDRDHGTWSSRCPLISIYLFQDGSSESIVPSVNASFLIGCIQKKIAAVPEQDYNY